jgi:mannose-6-phosphate isomerase-like protein (cupin superfamily)
MHRINLEEKLSRFSDTWNPKIIGELNGQQVKLVRIRGEFVWHAHDNEDELFFVIKGSFRMDFRDKSVVLSENDMIIVPRGVEHRPVAEEEACIMLFEPSSTLNTGNTENKFTKKELEII